MSMAEPQSVAQIIVDSLFTAGVKVAFGIPGAKVDAIFNELLDHPEIRLIVCRHEQNAAMMAAAVGRITGIPGVCIATSGPGAANLTTGLVTATTECDPVVAIVGSVSRLMSNKKTHQSMKALDILGPTVKFAENVEVEDQAAEVVLAAFRAATTSPKGATVMSIPMDVAAGKSKIGPFPKQAFAAPTFGPAPAASIKKVARMIENAKFPVLFLGMRAASTITVEAVRRFLGKYPIPTIETFQAAGAVSEDLVHLFYGRVGLFRNQTGDKLISKSDLIITLGYDPTEYDASAWNPDGNRNIVHIDVHSCDYGAYYHPEIELLGSVSENLSALYDELQSFNDITQSETCQELSKDFVSWQKRPEVSQTSGFGPPAPIRHIAPTERFQGHNRNY